MRVVAALFLVLSLASCSGSGGVSNFIPDPQRLTAPAGMYMNPLPISVPGGGTVESCPDPSIIRGQAGDSYWYMYCTNERFTDSAPVHLLPISKSLDLVNWIYVGDVFTTMPSWVASNGGLWAPDIQFFNGKYYLYYSVSNTTAGGAAIYVVTSDSPTGPWTAFSTPVVEPQWAPCCAGTLRATIDSAIVSDASHRYILYGSFNGGISARVLSDDGMQSSPATQVQIAVADRYEAAYVVKHDGYYYLMASAGACCDGVRSGYGVFAARSVNPLGPYVDADGNLMTEARVGGTPVLAMNGNRWIGPGHNAVVTDAAGQDWMLYHAIDENKPVFAGSWTRRPVMLDAIDWVDGWPRVRDGAGPSDSPQPAPSMNATAAPSIRQASYEALGAIDIARSDEFDGNALGYRWSWVRRPSPSAYAVESGALRFDTQAGDIYNANQSTAVLTQSMPPGDFAVETMMTTTVPVAGLLNYVQGGLVIYKDDTHYVKLVSVAINGTRQIEFARSTGTISGHPDYGSQFLASPTDTTYLRLVRKIVGGRELYTAYSSHNGMTWERGGTWSNPLGSGAKIGLVSMGRAGFAHYFDYFRVRALAR